MSFVSSVPKGCPNIPYLPTRTSRASGTVWSAELTKKDDNSCNAWLYYNIDPKPSGVTGKKFDLDLVFTYKNASFFNQPATYCDIAFQFYSIVAQSWSQYFLWNTWQISDNNGASGTNLWNNYSNYGRYRPAWGLFNKTVRLEGVTINASGPTYEEYANMAAAAGMSPPRWDQTSIYSYSFWCPWGVRYLSNGLNAQPSRRYPDAGPFISQHGQTSRTITYQSLDKGGTASGIKTIDLSADYIRGKLGTLSGVTAFKMRVRMGWSPLDSQSFCTWYFGGNNPKAEAEDTFTTIDNPQIGLLDYGPRGDKPATWPPRFDAQAWYRNQGGTPLKLQARYKTRDGSWNIF